ADAKRSQFRKPIRASGGNSHRLSLRAGMRAQKIEHRLLGAINIAERIENRHAQRQPLSFADGAALNIDSTVHCPSDANAPAQPFPAMRAAAGGARARSISWEATRTPKAAAASSAAAALSLKARRGERLAAARSISANRRPSPLLA